MEKMRRGLVESIALALIVLISTIITVVFEKETDQAIAKVIYLELNITALQNELGYTKIIYKDKEK